VRLRKYIVREILGYIAQRGVTYVNDIIRGTGLSPRTVVKYVNELEKEGLIKSERIGGVKLVTLTERGKDTLSEIITQFSGS